MSLADLAELLLLVRLGVSHLKFELERSLDSCAKVKCRRLTKLGLPSPSTGTTVGPASAARQSGPKLNCARSGLYGAARILDLRPCFGAIHFSGISLHVRTKKKWLGLSIRAKSCRVQHNTTTYPGRPKNSFWVETQATGNDPRGTKTYLSSVPSGSSEAHTWFDWS